MARKIRSKEQLDASIEKAKTAIRQGENLVKQLRNQTSQQERKERTRRLIERGAIAESLIPGAAELSNEQFKALLTVALFSPAARATLNGLNSESPIEPGKRPVGDE
jgi:hypothetical protein